MIDWHWSAARASLSLSSCLVTFLPTTKQAQKHIANRQAKARSRWAASRETTLTTWYHRRLWLECHCLSNTATIPTTSVLVLCTDSEPNKLTTWYYYTVLSIPQIKAHNQEVEVTNERTNQEREQERTRVCVCVCLCLCLLSSPGKCRLENTAKKESA